MSDTQVSLGFWSFTDSASITDIQFCRQDNAVAFFKPQYISPITTGVSGLLDIKYYGTIIIIIKQLYILSQYHRALHHITEDTGHMVFEGFSPVFVL